MRSSHHTPSATSLPRAPRDGADSRARTYLITMGIRVMCFALMVLVTPYGWYTWVFGAAAIFLPYIAVVFANVDQDMVDDTVERPERALPAATSAPDTTTRHTAADDRPRVIRIEESRPTAGESDRDG